MQQKDASKNNLLIGQGPAYNCPMNKPALDSNPANIIIETMNLCGQIAEESCKACFCSEECYNPPEDFCSIVGVCSSFALPTDCS